MQETSNGHAPLGAPEPLALTLIAVCLGGCAAEEPRIVDDPIAAGLMPADWLGTNLGVAQPVFVDRGEPPLVSAAEVKATTRVVHPSTGDFQSIADDAVTVIDLTKRHAYDVTLPAAVDRVAAARAAQLAQALAGVAPERVDVRSPRSTAKVVNGVDRRAPMGLAQGYGPDTWLSAIGSLTSGGTATLIGPKVAITVAHAMHDARGAYAEQALFHPRGDWSEGDWNPVWGAWEVTQIIVPAAYERNNCHTHPTVDCEQYDIAFLRLEPDATVPGHRWWFAVAAETHAELATRTLKNRGYPSCFAGTPPPGCMQEVLYGDLADCALGPDVPPFSEEFAPVVFHGCDTNEGHSGSPMFYYTPNGQPVMVGVHVGGRVPPPSETPNVFKRFSPNTLKWIHGLL